MGAKLTYDQIVTKLNNVSNNTSKMSLKDSDVFTTNTKVTFTHICGYSYSTKLSRVLNGSTDICAKCSGKYRKVSLEDIQTSLKKMNLELVSPELYLTVNQKLDVRFKCGCIENRSLNNIYKAKYNPQCQTCIRKNPQVLDIISAQKKLNSFKYGSLTILEEEFNGYKIPFKYKCNLCNKENIESLSVLVSREGKCKFCFGSYSSIQECYINILLKDLKVSFQAQYKIDQYPYDFYLEDHKVLIEFDGKQHISNTFKGKEFVNNDVIKNNLAVQNGYKLYRIKNTGNVLISILNILSSFNDYPVREYIQVDGNAEHLLVK